jgi:hypothetical protein
VLDGDGWLGHVHSRLHNARRILQHVPHQLQMWRKQPLPGCDYFRQCKVLCRSFQGQHGPPASERIRLPMHKAGRRRLLHGLSRCHRSLHSEEHLYQFELLPDFQTTRDVVPSQSW